MSEDLIRRSDAIKALRLEYPMMPMFKSLREEWAIKTEGYRKAEEVIMDIPTIEPKRGYWETVFMSEATGWDISAAGRDPIYGHRCSICKEETFNNDVGEEMLTNFCPNCGADMRKERASDDNSTDHNHCL